MVIQWYFDTCNQIEEFILITYDIIGLNYLLSLTPILYNNLILSGFLKLIYLYKIETFLYVNYNFNYNNNNLIFFIFIIFLGE